MITDEKTSRVLLVLLALSLMLVPIKFYFDIQESYAKAVEAGMLLDTWQIRSWLYIEITSIEPVCSLITSLDKIRLNG